MALFQFSSFDPVTGLLNLQRDLERVFEKPVGFDSSFSGRGVFPPVNIFNQKDAYIVRLEIPGVSPDALHVEGQGRTLTIRGTRDFTPPENSSMHRRERTRGEFSRSLQLPETLDPARADATYRNGVLTIRVPKREEAKPRQISVKAA